MIPHEESTTERSSIHTRINGCLTLQYHRRTTTMMVVWTMGTTMIRVYVLLPPPRARPLYQSIKFIVVWPWPKTWSYPNMFPWILPNVWLPIRSFRIAPYSVLHHDDAPPIPRRRHDTNRSSSLENIRYGVISNSNFIIRVLPVQQQQLQQLQRLVQPIIPQVLVIRYHDNSIPLVYDRINCHPLMSMIYCSGQQRRRPPSTRVTMTTTTPPPNAVPSLIPLPNWMWRGICWEETTIGRPFMISWRFFPICKNSASLPIVCTIQSRPPLSRRRRRRLIRTNPCNIWIYRGPDCRTLRPYLKWDDPFPISRNWSWPTIIIIIAIILIRGIRIIITMIILTMPRRQVVWIGC